MGHCSAVMDLCLYVCGSAGQADSTAAPRGARQEAHALWQATAPSCLVQQAPTFCLERSGSGVLAVLPVPSAAGAKAQPDFVA